MYISEFSVPVENILLQITIFKLINGHPVAARAQKSLIFLRKHQCDFIYDQAVLLFRPISQFLALIWWYLYMNSIIRNLVLPKYFCINWSLTFVLLVYYIIQNLLDSNLILFLNLTVDLDAVTFAWFNWKLKIFELDATKVTPYKPTLSNFTKCFLF